MNLKWQKFFFHSTGGWKSPRSKFWQGSVSDDSSLSGCRWPPSHCIVTRPLLWVTPERERSLFSQGYGLSFMTLSVCMLSCFSLILCPWDSPGKYTAVVCHALLQGIFPTQGLNLCLYISYTGGGWGFRGGSNSKESAWNVRDLGSIPGLGRSPGEGNGYPLQYSCLENSRYREEPGRLQSMELQRIRSQKAGWLIPSLFCATRSPWGSSVTFQACSRHHIANVASFVSHSARLLHPRDSPGENSGVGCHAFFQP